MPEPGKRRRDGAALLTVVGLIIITILSMWRLKRMRFKFIHVTGGAMLYGALLGLAVKCLSSARGEDLEGVRVCLNGTHLPATTNVTTQARCYRCTEEGLSPHTSQGCPLFPMLDEVTFDPEVLLNLFLPPIIFHGAYTLNQRRFINNLGSVLTFALLGTIISCGIIGACVYGFTRLMVLAGQAAEPDFPFIDCLLFGAMVSTTDPVSVLGLLSELRVDPDLHALLFGESVLNDATAIVLTHAIGAYRQVDGGHAFSAPTFFLSMGHFLAVFAGSFFLGFAFAVTTALLTKFTRLSDCPLLETSLLFLLSWCSFLSAEACGLSGIVAVLFCGLTQARYTLHNLSLEAKTRARQLFEFFNFLGEIFIFTCMGYVLLTFPCHVFKALFISGAFLAIFVSRAFNIYPLSFLLNLGRQTKIPCNVQHFMMFAGLRGAVAFSLAIRDTSKEVKRTILTTTLLVVCSTVWLLGAAARPVLRRLNIRRVPSENPTCVSSIHCKTAWHRQLNEGNELEKETETFPRTDYIFSPSYLFLKPARALATAPMCCNCSQGGGRKDTNLVSERGGGAQGRGRARVDADEDPEDCSPAAVDTGRPRAQAGRPDRTAGLWHRLDSKYLKPALTHCGPPLTSSLPGWCRPLARLFSPREDKEQLQEMADGTPDEMEKAEEDQQEHVGGNAEPGHQEDLEAGDLGLGTGQPPAAEERPGPPGVSSIHSLSETVPASASAARAE
ncbi:sodium/hydrogen exchanger 9-like [Lampris incognitus]|uniref:sodium/hydrogen exchanger 9-like n=1 Tax=Lampris incognitus TaxID=2546036 RepID=UPI0024B5FFF4|nr:sodium/hydrogen exchanger 9-like [Lampris incognitus]